MVESQQNSLLGKIAAYTEILSSDPRSTIFVPLSESYRRMGMLDDAFSVAVKGLKFLPDYGPGHVVLARIQCQQDDLVGSEKSFKKALQLDGDNLAALVGCSRLFLLQDLTLEAKELLLKARDLSPADSVINKLLLSIPEEEIAEFQNHEELTEEVSDPSSVSMPEVPSTVEPFQSVTLADLYLKQGFVEKSLAVFKSLLLRDPDNLELRRRIRDVEAKVFSPPDSVIESTVEPIIVDTPVTSEITLDKTHGLIDEVSELSVGKATVLEQLNCLLASIQRRRGDV